MMHLTYDLWTDAFELYDRIVEHYGVPVWWDIEPDLICYYDPMEPYYGWHTLDEIGVNFAICDDWADVVGTLIHEYHHHMQDPKRGDEPEYEAEAVEITMRDLHLFLVPQEA